MFKYLNAADMKTSLLVFAVVRLACSGYAFMDSEIIKSFLRERRLMQANVVTCYNKTDEVRLAKALNTEVIMLSVCNFKYINILDTLFSKHSRSAVIVDGDCLKTNHFLRRCGKYRVFDSKHYWLVLTANARYFDIFEGVEINIDANINVLYPSNVSSKENSENYIVEDLYNPASQRGGTLKKTFLGIYNMQKGFPPRDPRSKYWAKKNFTGIKFKTVIVLPEPYEGDFDEYLESDKNPEINTFNRFHSRLVDYCSRYYNFSMNRTAYKSWGYLQSDGTMDGMVGAMERRKIDFGLSPLFVKKDRGKVISYGRLTWILRAGFIFRNPKSTKSLDIFVKPLSVSVWALIIILSIASIIVLKYSLSYESRKKHKEDVETTWSYCLMCTVGALCQQGATSTPDMVCGRIAVIFTFLLAVLVYQFYSASLVSFLLTNPISTINTLQDLLKSNLRVGCEEILYDRDYFKFATDNTTLDLYQKIINQRGNESFLTPEDGLRLVEKGNYAFHVELATAYPIINERYSLRTICELREVPMFGVKPMHANYVKHSSFKDLIDVCLQRLAEHGILDKERKFWHPGRPECIHNANTIKINTGLQEFFSALLILGIGIILSLIILIGEMFIKFRESRKREGLLLYPYVN